MIGFIGLFEEHRGEGGPMRRAEPICKVLADGYGAVVPRSGYHGCKNRPQSKRMVEDGRLKAGIIKAYEENCSCYGVVKM